jgi:hypothetical protein
MNEFEQLLKSLFSFNGNSYFIQKPKIKNILTYYDSNKVRNGFLICKFFILKKKIIKSISKNKDEKLDQSEFAHFWNTIVKQVIEWLIVMLRSLKKNARIIFSFNLDSISTVSLGYRGRSK